MRVRLQTLGCRLNESELEAWARDFQRRGCRVATEDETADLVVVNTCAVTVDAVRKSRKLLRRAQRDNPRARLVVSGCAASLEDEDLGDTGIDLLVPNTHKERLVEIAVRELDLPLMPATASEPAAAALFARGRQRAFIKIQDGCRYQCTFCVTTRARGDERSRPAAAICDEINLLAAGGVREVVLTGVHLGGYGSDLTADAGANPGISPGADASNGLVSLLQRILRETDVPRLRLGSLEPWDLPDAFWQLFENPRLMPHLHLPLQSGADSVLRRMARRCKRDEFLQLVERARAAIPELNITTDIIVGFPGETDDDWQQTMDLVQRIGFGHLHIFAYSPRAGTRAATMPDQVPAEVRRERSRALHALGLELKRALLTRHLGQCPPVLIEGSNRDADGEFAAGFTPNYLPVRLRGAPSGLVNRTIRVRLDAVSSDGEAVNALLADAQ
ncbi:tRNA (N(6)-L-threonylcarbamoyladenosine(37)-C(2))-methylthiotransferase MtaB [Thiohalocapsa marina]|uniref:tRNA (N(6)-L-threonylcarbamoyladenosine(37)-C(2))-methylthiotransferase MtaB n=1 Tax=Thiohalocapsa marina TaxID=424902 RepID=A0A5M8FS69_9GAMM|nr:tRNA (N(6)-L-threonylcarbamoyladenosine(37)-C(2))-methylthiotransferase MtaB [Thiohalocapsa marina]KAA6184682.1 tRNA (N(6)-L-threonylcarbamoyladenosine(37)-C(2))-methylthiotransferase MtaB [Thiohalocapsa marina]